MPYLAVDWIYIALGVLAVLLLLASPFLFVLFRSARAIAHTSTDGFRLRHANMWTEPRHTPEGGSVQLMRLKDGHFVLLSVGVSTVKIFTTPDRSDVAQYQEIQEFAVPSILERMGQTPQRRRSENSLLLDRVRRTIGWPESVTDLVSSVQSMDCNVLRHAGPHA